MNTSLASNRGTLQERAALFAQIRNFFSKRGVLEVDTLLLRPTPPIDAHIEIMRVDMGQGKWGYLHSSPEYELKKILAAGSGDLYQLSHVFRAEEEGPLHSGEFTMLEWYRVGMNLPAFISETVELISLVLKKPLSATYTYNEAFSHFAGLDMYDDLTPHLTHFNEGASSWDRDTQLNLLFSHLVEPHLQGLTVITEFPGSQAALAKKELVDGKEIARRFEIYYRGIELANGFDELNSSSEQRARLEEENQKRIDLGRNPLPLDEEFVACLDHLPDCCGVAVGVDRLAMLTSSRGQ